MQQLTSHPRARIIVVASEKGGVSKTTEVTCLGHAFALQKRNTLIIDADPRGDASTALGLPTAPGIYEHLILGKPFASQAIPADRPAGVPPGPQTPALLRPHLTILRGNQTTRRTATILQDEIATREKPAEFIPAAWCSIAAFEGGTQGAPAPGTGVVEIILIDTPPNGGFWPEQNYRAADLLIIPTSMDNIDKGAAIATYSKIREMGITAPIYIQPTIYVPTESVDQANLESLKLTFGAAHILPPIPRAAAIKQCRAAGQTIFEYAPKSKPAKTYQQIATWLASL